MPYNRRPGAGLAARPGYHSGRVPSPLEIAVLVAAGILAGTLNVVAGGGSFLTLPLLIFLGLPASVANGTNRVGVLLQNVSAVWAFRRHGALDARWTAGVAVPAMAGALLGARLALAVPDFAFTRLLSTAMLGLTLWSIWSARRESRRTEGRHLPRWAVWTGFFAMGIYGGFIQAGVGFFILALTTAAGLDLLRGNAVKVLGVLLMTGLSLAIFGGAGIVDWPRGGALGVGNLIGGLLGVRLAVLQGQRWLERVVTATVAMMALLLWLT